MIAKKISSDLRHADSEKYCRSNTAKHRKRVDTVVALTEDENIQSQNNLPAHLCFRRRISARSAFFLSNSAAYPADCSLRPQLRCVPLCRTSTVTLISLFTSFGTRACAVRPETPTGHSRLAPETRAPRHALTPRKAGSRRRLAAARRTRALFVEDVDFYRTVT